MRREPFQIVHTNPRFSSRVERSPRYERHVVRGSQVAYQRARKVTESEAPAVDGLGQAQASMESGLGNQAMVELLGMRHSRPGDRYERQADEIASRQRPKGALTQTMPSPILDYLGTGEPIGGSLLAELERQFGPEVRQIRVHRGPRAQALAQACDARGFTLGADIVLADEDVLHHEVGHVFGEGPADMVLRQSQSSPTIVTEVLDTIVQFATTISNMASLGPNFLQSVGNYVDDLLRAHQGRVNLLLGVTIPIPTPWRVQGRITFNFEGYYALDYKNRVEAGIRGSIQGGAELKVFGWYAYLELTLADWAADARAQDSGEVWALLMYALQRRLNEDADGIGLSRNFFDPLFGGPEDTSVLSNLDDEEYVSGTSLVGVGGGVHRRKSMGDEPKTPFSGATGDVAGHTGEMFRIEGQPGGGYQESRWRRNRFHARARPGSWAKPSGLDRMDYVYSESLPEDQNQEAIHQHRLSVRFKVPEAHILRYWFTAAGFYEVVQQAASLTDPDSPLRKVIDPPPEVGPFVGSVVTSPAAAALLGKILAMGDGANARYDRRNPGARSPFLYEGALLIAIHLFVIQRGTTWLGGASADLVVDAKGSLDTTGNGRADPDDALFAGLLVHNNIHMVEFPLS